MANGAQGDGGMEEASSISTSSFDSGYGVVGHLGTSRRPEKWITPDSRVDLGSEVLFRVLYT